MDEHTKARILFEVRKNNGPKVAHALGKMELSPEIVEILRYAENVEITPEVKGFLYFLMGREDLVPKNPHEGKSLEDVEQQMLQLFDEKGYFAYVVNPPNLQLNSTSIAGRQDAPIVYFDVPERWCTFTTARYEKRYIVHAIRKELIQDLNAVKNALEKGDFKQLMLEFSKAKDAIPKEDPPSREDEYSHSVITIQLDKETGLINIVGRRNHGIEKGKDPDRTFDAEPDQIAEGLTDCLKYYFGLHKLDPKLEDVLPGKFTLSMFKQIVKFHTEDFEGVCYNEKWYVKNANVHPLDEHMLCVENFIVDKKQREIKGVGNYVFPNLITVLNNELIILNENENDVNPYRFPKRRDVEFGVDKKTGEKFVSVRHQDKWVRMITFKKGKITRLYLPTTRILPPSVMRNFYDLEEFSAPQLEIIERANFFQLPQLKRFYAPNVRKIDKHCFFQVGMKGHEIPEFDFPNLETISSGSFHFVNAHVKAENLIYVADNSFHEVFGKVQAKAYISKENLMFVRESLKAKFPYERIPLFTDEYLSQLCNLVVQECIQKDEHGHILLDENAQVRMLPIEAKMNEDNQYKYFYIRDEKGQKKHILTFNSYGYLVDLSLPTTRIIPKRITANGCERLESFNAPNLIEIEDNNFCELRSFNKAYLPRLEKVGTECFCRIKGGFDLPMLKEVGENSLKNISEAVNTPLLERKDEGEENPFIPVYSYQSMMGKI